MKQCPNCGKTYEDIKSFCPVCGVPLQSAAPGKTPASKPDANAFFQQWGGTALAIAGLVFTLLIHCVPGLILAVAGIVVGSSSPNPKNKTYSKAVGAIAAVLSVLVLIFF